MSREARGKAPGVKAAPLMHWLALLSGLGVLTVERADVPAKVAPLWLGAVLGTLLGQLFAVRRTRLWFALILLGTVTVFATLLTAPFWLATSQLGGTELELTVAAFVPAAVCAMLACGDRSTLAGLWFPVSLWTLAVLDHTRSAGGARLLLLAGPVAMIVGGFYAHETRRVALWRRRAEVRERVLRESPTGAAWRGAWSVLVAAASFALTLGVAPKLWQTDPHDDARTASRASSASSAAGAGSVADRPCCPTSGSTTHATVRDYFTPVAASRDLDRMASSACQVCAADDELMDGAPGGTRSRGELAADVGGSGSAPSVHTPFTTTTPAPARATPVSGDSAPAGPIAPIAPSTPASPTPVSTSTPVAAAPSVLGRAPSSHVASRAGATTPSVDLGVGAVTEKRSLGDDVEPNPLPWLVALAGVAALGSIGARLLRRALAVRHLREPIWPEPIDQRISNLWQLALVGLRDRGFVSVPGEAPQALARRTQDAAMAACATILDRARHGVRLDAGDLEAMRAATTQVYAEARREAGFLGRALGALRWPLV